MQNQLRQSGSSGFSLLEALLALGLSGLAVLMLSRSLSQMPALDAKSNDTKDIIELKYSILSEMDCAQTLGNPPAAALPLTCRNVSNLTLKRRNGSSIQPVSSSSNAWSLLANCQDGAGLVIGVSKPGLEPVSRKPWNQIDWAKDIFNGTGNFCYPFFMARAAPSDRDLECFDIKRTAGSGTTLSDPNYASYAMPFDSIIDGEQAWGSSCRAPFVRAACLYNNPTTYGQRVNFSMMPGGCYSGAIEFAERGTLITKCCRRGDTP